MTRINHNIASMITQGSLQQNTTNLEKSLERLSTGLRINRGADDVAGLSVSEKLRTQVRGTAAAAQNANDGIALLNIAEGACNETSNILQRMRELAVQADSDTYGTTERSFMNQEFQSLMQEMQRISVSTNYNGMTLLDGAPGSFGAIGGTSSILHLGTNFAGVNGADPINTMQVQMSSMTLGALGLTQTTTSIVSRDGAFSALNAVDDAIRSVSTVRSSLGAAGNRLDHALQNLNVQEVNLTSAESAIRDVDFAKETTEFTRNQILVQSATSMLTQANQTPQHVLELLK
jgi:flagellin